MVRSVYVKPMRPIPLLYVDNDPTLCRAAVKFLSRFGYQVLAVPGIKEAKKALASQPFDVVLSDVGLDDGTGTDLHAWVRENLPHMVRKFVFVSGGLGLSQQEYLLAAGLPLLSKPFDWGHVVLTLQQIVPPSADSEPPPSRGPSSEDGNLFRGSSRRPTGSDEARSQPPS